MVEKADAWLGLAEDMLERYGDRLTPLRVETVLKDVKNARAALLVEARREFILCQAPAYPDPLKIHPPTVENARRAQAEHGGEVLTRLVTEWRVLDG